MRTIHSLTKKLAQPGPVSALLTSNLLLPKQQAAGIEFTWVKALVLQLILTSTMMLPKHSMAESFDFTAMMAATYEQTLTNGLKVVVREDHRSPVIVFQIWYQVGSSDEPNHMTGISHVLEHMMFKGTSALPPGEFSQWVANLGGAENAFTTRNQTVYYQSWTRQNLPLSVALEADRMTNLTLPEEEFKKEVQVVMEERRLRTEDNPTAKLYESFNRAAFTSSPYGQPVIGWMHDLEALTVADLKQWYQKWYTPKNAVIVVAGDVSAKETFKLVEKHFGSINSQPLPKRLKPREIEPRGEKRIHVKATAQVPKLLMGFVAPSSATASQPEEAHALYMLSGVLDGGYSARLSERLVRTQRIAAGVSAGYSPIDRGDTLFLFSATPSNDTSIESLEAAIWDEIKALQDNPPDQSEINRVKSQIIAGLVYEQDSLEGQASSIGQLESSGLGWRAFPELVRGLEAVTPEQIQSVAKKYLTPDRLTVGILDPQPLDTTKPPQASES